MLLLIHVCALITKFPHSLRGSKRAESILRSVCVTGANDLAVIKKVASDDGIDMKSIPSSNNASPKLQARTGTSSAHHGRHLVRSDLPLSLSMTNEQRGDPDEAKLPPSCWARCHGYAEEIPDPPNPAQHDLQLFIPLSAFHSSRFFQLPYLFPWWMTGYFFFFGMFLS